MPSRDRTPLTWHMTNALAGLFLFAVNVMVYVTRPRLIAMFRRRTGFFPNVAEPKSVNDKVTWRKVFDRNPLFPVLQDKLAARDYVAAHCPDMALPEILWQGHDPFAIPFDQIREPVVIKTNHGCGFNWFVPDPDAVDGMGISLFFAQALSTKWGGANAGEWAYGMIKPLVYVEKMLQKEDGSPVDDCKINVFHGKSHVYSLTRGRFDNRETVYFDADNRRVEAALDNYGADFAPTPGPLHDLARTYAEALCPQLDAVRIDCYIHEGRVWFGEFTVYPGSGFQQYNPPSFAIERARPWNILDSHYFTVPGRFRRLYRRSLEARVRPSASSTVSPARTPSPGSQRTGGA